MDGTIAQKILRLTCAMARRPGGIARYLKALRKSPIEMGLPWMSYGSIDFLAGWLQPHHEVFEFGSGGSTVFFARRAKSVLSIDDSDRWAERVRSELTRQGCANARVVAAELPVDDPGSVPTSEYAAALKDDYDVIVCDSQEHWPRSVIRPHLFYLSETHVRPNGVIVLDDSWRYPGIREKNKARRSIIFRDVGPGRFGVTETDIFFY